MNPTNHRAGALAYAGASRKTLEELHRLLAEHLLRRLRSDEDIKASFLGVTRAFLADNGITSNSLKDARSGLAGLVRDLERIGEFDRVSSPTFSEPNDG